MDIVCEPEIYLGGGHTIPKSCRPIGVDMSRILNDVQGGYPTDNWAFGGGILGGNSILDAIGGAASYGADAPEIGPASSASEISSWQAFLARKAIGRQAPGLIPGPGLDDGIWGAGTAAATKQYQQVNIVNGAAIDPSGYVRDSTLAAAAKDGWSNPAQRARLTAGERALAWEIIGYRPPQTASSGQSPPASSPPIASPTPAPFDTEEKILKVGIGVLVLGAAAMLAVGVRELWTATSSAR